MGRNVKEENSARTKQFLSFTLDQEVYGLDIMVAESIERMSEFTRVPKTPEYVLGVTNIRGDIVPVINLRQRLGMKDKEYDEDTRIIISKFEDYRIGMVVDRAKDILSVPEKNIQESRDIFKDGRDTLFSQVIKLEGQYILILDLIKILDLGDII